MSNLRVERNAFVGGKFGQVDGSRDSCVFGWKQTKKLLTAEFAENGRGERREKRAWLECVEF